MPTPTELKKEWETEKKRLEQRVIDIKSASKEIWSEYSYTLVTADQFKELEDIATVLNGNIIKPHRKAVCECCEIQPPVIGFRQEYNNLIFMNPPPFSSIFFYLTLDIPKGTVLREFEKFYDKALNSPELGWRTDDLWKLIHVSLTKEEYKCFIINPDKKREDERMAESLGGFQSNFGGYKICEACESKGIVEKLRIASLGYIERNLSLLHLNKGDYQASIRVQKEKIW